MTDGQALWERLAGELEATDPAISHSTMMGLPGLRLDGAFFASLGKRTDELIVKLAADDVAVCVADGRAHSFAPAGKVFREWAVVTARDEPSWRSAVSDALAFAHTK